MLKDRKMKRQVVVTGMGIVSPIGVGLKEFEKNLFAGKNGIGRITHFDPSLYRSQMGGEVNSLDFKSYFSTKEMKRMDRFTQLGMIAVKEAIKEASLDVEEKREKVGVLIGSGVGGLSTIEREQTVLLEKGPQRVSPFLVPMLITSILSAQVAIKYNFSGPNFSISTACATGNHSIGEASKIIQRGEADVMIAGGAEGAITPLGLAGFCSMRVLSTRNDEPKRASRPFDKERNGFVIGEGAGIVVLEELERAKKRGAFIWAKIDGFGMNEDAYHITQPVPDGKGVKLAIREALRDAEVNCDQLDYINAHGTSTLLNDKVETKAIKDVFGNYAYKIPVSSTKSMTGHLLGAAGGVEIIACILSIQRGIIHPTINYEVPDPECDLDYVPNCARKVNVRVALSISMGFGGHNAILVVKKI